MLTIDRLVNIDNIATRIITALYRGVAWVDARYDDRLVDATYRVAESKAADVGKAEGKISDLEDARSELVAHGIEAKVLLQEKYKAALAALDKELASKGDKLDSDLAAAAEALVAANKDYDATVRAANEKLGVKVDA